MKILALINGLFVCYLALTGKLGSKDAEWSDKRAWKALIILFIFLIAISILSFTKYFDTIGSILEWIHPVITVMLLIKLYQLYKEKRLFVRSEK